MQHPTVVHSKATCIKIGLNSEPAPPLLNSIVTIVELKRNGNKGFYFTSFYANTLFT